MSFQNKTKGLMSLMGHDTSQAIFGARWRRDNLKKIASPSQAKNRSFSRGLNRTFSQIKERSSSIPCQHFQVKGVKFSSLKCRDFGRCVKIVEDKAKFSPYAGEAIFVKQRSLSVTAIPFNAS